MHAEPREIYRNRNSEEGEMSQCQAIRLSLLSRESESGFLVISGIIGSRVTPPVTPPGHSRRHRWQCLPIHILGSLPQSFVKYAGLCLRSFTDTTVGFGAQAGIACTSPRISLHKPYSHLTASGLPLLDFEKIRANPVQRCERPRSASS